MVDFSGGHPAMAHGIGDAVFNADQDDVVDRKDALFGIEQAAEIVGRKYLPQVYEAIHSPRYRKILRVLARDPQNVVFKRTGIFQQLDARERRVLDNFLQRMVELGVLVREEGRGVYRFRNALHFIYFGMEANRSGS
jgi:hypothetical protein